MSNYIVRDTAGLFDPTTGQWVGVIDGNGQEHVVVPAGSKAVSAATTSDGVVGISAPSGVLPAPAYTWTGGPHRKRGCVHGCSISAQDAAFCHSVTSNCAAVEHKAGGTTLNVVNGALFTAGQRITLPLHNNRMLTTTIVSISGNVLTIADSIPGLVPVSVPITVNTTGTVPSMDQAYGAANAGIALLGGPVEVPPIWGYGGATVQQMLPFLERDLRYYRPQYMITHYFENDLCGTVATGAATLDQLKAWARQQARMCLSYGAIPIICSPMPYYKPSGIGIPAVRTADFDGLRDYLCKPVTSDGLSQLQIDVPGSYGLDLSTPWLDPDFVNDASFARRPIYAKLLGGTLTAGERAMSAWTGITNGAFAVTLDGTPRTISGMNFSAATSMDQVASIIRTAMGSNGLCAWDATAGRFILRAPASISYVSTPGSGTDISAQIKAAEALASAAPTEGWTDGVHPTTAKRFAVGAFAAPTLAKILPPAGSMASLAEYLLTNREISLMTGTGGTATNLQPGSVVPKGVQVVAYGAAQATTSKNSDGSLKIAIAWPGAASRSADYVTVKYTWTFPAVLSGGNVSYREAVRFRINSMVNVAQVFPEVTFTPTGENHTGSFAADMARSLPADGSMIHTETPVFVIGSGTTSLQIAFTIRPVDAATGAMIDVDLGMMGILPAIPEVPHSYV